MSQTVNVSINYRLTRGHKLANNSGFTLVELLITVSIAGILLGIAIPSFTSSITSNRLTTNANEFVSALNLARSEAIKREQPVVLKRKGEASGQWNAGWQVFVDIDRTTTAKENTLDAGTDILLRDYTGLPGQYSLLASTNFVDYIRYEPSGLINASGNFVLCSSAATTVAPNIARLIVINAVGRARLGLDGDKNGIPNTDSGTTSTTDISSCTTSPAVTS